MAKYVGWISRIPQGKGMNSKWKFQANYSRTDDGKGWVRLRTEKTIISVLDTPQQAIEAAEEYYGTSLKLEETINSELGYRILCPANMEIFI